MPFRVLMYLGRGDLGGSGFHCEGKTSQQVVSCLQDFVFLNSNIVLKFS